MSIQTKLWRLMAIRKVHEQLYLMAVGISYEQLLQEIAMSKRGNVMFFVSLLLRLANRLMMRIDPSSYLFGKHVVECLHELKTKAVILNGLHHSRKNSQAVVASRRVALPVTSRQVHVGHLSTIPQILSQISFPVFKEKNYCHRHAMIEEFGILKTECVSLGHLPSGARRLPNSKVFVVTYVCRGTSVCSPPSYAVGKFSRRRYCGYGIRFYSRNKDPTIIFVEEFGSHYGEAMDGWKFLPPEVDRKFLTLHMDKEAQVAFQMDITPAKFLTKCSERALLSDRFTITNSAYHEIRNSYRYVHS